MWKRNVRDADPEYIEEQMRSLRKKLKKLKRTAADEVAKPRALTEEVMKPNIASNSKIQINTEDKENGE